MKVDEFLESLGERAKLPLKASEFDWHKAWIEVCTQYTELRNKHEIFRGKTHQQLKMAAATLDAARSELALHCPSRTFESEYQKCIGMMERIRFVEKDLRILVEYIERTSEVKPGA